MEQNKMKHNKNALIDALRKNMGIVSKACSVVGIGRTTFYRYMNEDPEFKKEVESIGEECIDFAESKLLENIDNNDTTSIIFYLKTKGRKRGYIDKQQIEVDSPITINLKKRESK